MDVLIWGGPVQRSDLGVEVPASCEVITLSRGPTGGIGSNDMRDLALSYVDDRGAILPSIVSRAGLDWSQVDRVFLAGFSAFHGLANEILARESARVSGCFCLDACFSAFGSLEKKGYVAFGQRAARAEAIFLLSASLGGGQTYSTGAQCVWANVEAACAAAGVALGELVVPEDVPPPQIGAQAGTLYAYDYQGEFTHRDHVLKLARPLLSAYLIPALQEDATPAAQRSWVKPMAIAAGLTTAALLGIGAAVKSKKEEKKFDGPARNR